LRREIKEFVVRYKLKVQNAKSAPGDFLNLPTDEQAFNFEL